MSSLRRVVASLGLAAVACGPSVPVDTGDPPPVGSTSTADPADDAVTNPSPSTTPATVTGTPPPPPPPPATTGPGPITTGLESSTSWDPTDPCNFICVDDGGNPLPIECSVWEQDCPEGEKCAPWANDGGNSWNATRCVPVAPDPDSVGESCLAEGSGVSGVDSCDATSMCFGVDPETLEGTCFAFCTGDEATPMCEGTCDQCSLTGDGVLTLCLPACDPLAQDCDPGQTCLPYWSSFVCAPGLGDDALPPGEPCEYVNQCEVGSLCVNGDDVPGCEGANCCTPFCPLGDDTPCAAVPGTVCSQYLEPGEACSLPAPGACLAP